MASYDEVRSQIFPLPEVEKSMKSGREEPLVGHEEVIRQIHAIIAKARKQLTAQNYPYPS
jgi:hypothetical protein